MSVCCCKFIPPPPPPIQFKIFEILLKHCKNTFLYITSFTLQSDDLSSRNIYSSSILGSTMYPPLPPCVTSLPVMRLQVFSEDSSNSSSVQAHINFSFLRKVFKTVCQFVHPSILLLYWLYCRLALYLAAVALWSVTLNFMFQNYFKNVIYIPHSWIHSSKRLTSSHDLQFFPYMFEENLTALWKANKNKP